MTFGLIFESLLFLFIVHESFIIPWKIPYLGYLVYPACLYIFTQAPSVMLHLWVPEMDTARFNVCYLMCRLRCFLIDDMLCKQWQLLKLRGIQGVSIFPHNRRALWDVAVLQWVGLFVGGPPVDEDSQDLLKHIPHMCTWDPLFYIWGKDYEYVFF